jgi:hypothetical protein
MDRWGVKPLIPSLTTAPETGAFVLENLVDLAHPKLPHSVNPVRHFFWLGDGPRLGYQMRGDAARRRSARIARSAKTVRAMRRIRLPNKPGKVRNVAK